MQTGPLRSFATLLALFAILDTSRAVAGTAPAPAQGRVIVLGFDGADARTTAEMMDRGELPNLAKLRAEGTFAPLLSSVPNESAASWACLNSGQNPAKTGVQGFVKRTNGPRGPTPDLGLRVIEDRAVSGMQFSGALALLAPLSRPTVAAIAGAGTLLLFLLVFAALMRVRARAAVPLALALGVLAAWAGWVVRGYVLETIADVCGNPTAVGGFWEEAARAGVPSVVIDGAMSWDREPVENARVLAGLGLPDARGQNVDWFVYTTDPAENDRAPAGRQTSTAGTVYRVDEQDGRIESEVYGPIDYMAVDLLLRELDEIEAAREDSNKGYLELAELQRREEEIVRPRDGSGLLADARKKRLPLPVVAERLDGGRWRITLGDQSQELAEGDWSDWYRMLFRVNPLIAAHAVARCKLVRAGEPFELYLDTLQIDPENPPFWQPVSQPARYAKDLAGLLGGPYETNGWSCLTMPYKDEEIDEDTFLEDVDFTRGFREELMLAALSQDDWRLFVGIESTVDRLQHMLYRSYDPQHPGYDAVEAARLVRFDGREMPLSEVIPAGYRAIDRFVGRVMDEHMRPGDTLILCADHGFQSFRRQVNINNWLAEMGWLALRPGTTSSRYLEFVDWSRTKAYSLGLGMIFVNMRGREAQGTVDPEDAPALVDEIGRTLLELRDDDGTPACLEVYNARDVHSGPFFDDEADLYTGLAPNYRVSWRTTLGGIRLERDGDGGRVPGPVFEDNREPWSGDHVSMARTVVPGIFFSSRRVEVPTERVDLLEVAPTALSALGVEPPASYDRPPLRFLD